MLGLEFPFQETSLFLEQPALCLFEWQLTPVFLPGEFQGLRAWWATVHGVANFLRMDFKSVFCLFFS